MPIRVQCQCGGEWDVDDYLAGERILSSACSRRVTVPGPDKRSHADPLSIVSGSGRKMRHPAPRKKKDTRRLRVVLALLIGGLLAVTVVVAIVIGIILYRNGPQAMYYTTEGTVVVIHNTPEGERRLDPGSSDPFRREPKGGYTTTLRQGKAEVVWQGRRVVSVKWDGREVPER
jgi:hypothetical protein